MILQILFIWFCMAIGAHLANMFSKYTSGKGLTSFKLDLVVLFTAITVSLWMYNYI